jgi:hypothetical protein
MIDYTRYDKYRGLWAAQATDTETCPGTVGEHYRSSDEALADLIEAADGHDISTLWCDGSCSDDYDCTDKTRRACMLRWLRSEYNG